MSTVLVIFLSSFVFGTLIFVHELGHFICAKFSGIKVEEFSIGMGPSLLSIEGKETLYSLRLLPIGGFVLMKGEDSDDFEPGSFQSAKWWKRFLVVSAGALMNFLVGFLLLTGLNTFENTLASRTIGYFYDNALSHEAGLELGDTIVAVNGRRTYVIDDVFYEMYRLQDGTADFTVIRDGVKTEIQDITFETKINEDGKSQIVIDFKVYGYDKSFWVVLRESALWCVSVARLIFLSVIDLLTGRVAFHELSGPVGIVTVIGDAVAMGISQVAYLAAILSINLGVSNLLPIPSLDGGRIWFLVMEGITRKKIPQKYEAVINAAGFFLMMALMLAVTFNDITKLF